MRLFSATDESELDLDLLDARDHARIRYQRVNEETGREVPWERIVKAFHLEGRYVVLEDEDFKRAQPGKSESIAVHDFVDASEVGDKYYEKPYYLVPEKGGRHAYVLLREALRKSGRVGIASFVLRAKEHPAVLRPDGDVLLLDQLRYAEEIRDPKELKIPGRGKVPANEMKLALQLIEKASGPFHIKKYTDTYSAALMKLIHAKAKGRTKKAAPMKVVHRKPTDDLMETLKASLKSRTKRKKAG